MISFRVLGQRWKTFLDEGIIWGPQAQPGRLPSWKNTVKILEGKWKIHLITLLVCGPTLVGYTWRVMDRQRVPLVGRLMTVAKPRSA